MNAATRPIRSFWSPRWLGTVLVFAALALVAGRADAQFFPPEGGLSALEKQAAKAAEAEHRAAVEAAEAAKRAAENQRRWESMLSLRKKSATELQADMNNPRGEWLTRANKLLKRKKLFDLGALYYRCGQYRRAATYLKQALRATGGWEVSEGWALMLYIENELASSAYDADEPLTPAQLNKIKRKVDMAKRLIKAARAEKNQRSPDKRKEVLGALDEWLNEYKDNVVRAEALRAAVEHDPNDPQKVWRLATHLRDSLRLWFPSRTWLAVLRGGNGHDLFPDWPGRWNGDLDIAWADYLSRAGFVDRAVKLLEERRGEVRQAFDRRREARKELRRKLKRGEINEDDLTEDERQLLRGGEDERKMRERIGEHFDDARKEAKRRRNEMAERAGDERRDGGDGGSDEERRKREKREREKREKGGGRH